MIAARLRRMHTTDAIAILFNLSTTFSSPNVNVHTHGGTVRRERATEQQKKKWNEGEENGQKTNISADVLHFIAEVWLQWYIAYIVEMWTMHRRKFYASAKVYIFGKKWCFILIWLRCVRFLFCSFRCCHASCIQFQYYSFPFMRYILVHCVFCVRCIHRHSLLCSSQLRLGGLCVCWWMYCMR